MTVTSNGAPASAFAAASPPKPAPTMTTRFMAIPARATRSLIWGDRSSLAPASRLERLKYLMPLVSIAQVYRCATGSGVRAGKSDEQAGNKTRADTDHGDPVADRGFADRHGAAARGRKRVREADGRSRFDRRRRTRRIPPAAICAAAEGGRVQQAAKHHRDAQRACDRTGRCGQRPGP